MSAKAKLNPAADKNVRAPRRIELRNLRVALAEEIFLAKMAKLSADLFGDGKMIIND